MLDSGTDNATILVVDDEECLLNLIRIVLTQEGYTVLGAESAEEGLLIMQSSAGNIDLLLTDMRLPNMSGGELAKEFKTAYPASKVIYMTAYSPEDATLRLPGEIVLFKPFYPELLCDMVKTSLAGLTSHKLPI
ncbi:response regulator [Pontiella agarivorans]|uniref:Response regulator n=1 Tax=Pontiella agarivorans TaxID=3038953 RepID=A0ABU5MSV1_9BACT|nr:response regulator [Pontiella agarivorans]MDZ8117240.1 response regulator [Pontiella agarivorans]